MKDGRDFRAALDAMQPRDLLIWDRTRGLDAYRRDAVAANKRGRVYRTVSYQARVYVIRIA